MQPIMTHTVCSNCGFNNPPAMRFCGNCGSRLGTVPVAVPEIIEQDTEAESVRPTGQPTLDPEQIGVLTGVNLIDRFRKAGLEASGQRRSVTVLFVDLSGYTHLSEQLGDEELYELVQKFIRLLVNDVYKYEGMVDKLTGDGLMALFGAPIAYENNAERAIRSALDMVIDVERLSRELRLEGNELRIHVGLNSGTVIVGGVGGDGLMNYTAIGDSVNLARRLEEAAGPGTILISESVFRQTSRLFIFEELAPMPLKNVSRPVISYRVVASKDKPETMRGIEGLRAPMIGREQEFTQVTRMVQRLIDERVGGVILLVGEGGMGKSRLTSELKSRLDYHQLVVLEGQSLTYRKSIPYWIFQDLIRNSIGTTSETPIETVHRKLVAAVQEKFGRTAKEKLTYLEHLFSLQPSDPSAAEKIKYLDPGQLRQQVFLAVRDLLVGIAQQFPVIIILEDLHWADDASLDLIRFLIDSTRSAPIMIYAISRPFEGGAVQAIHERAQQRLGERYSFLRLQALPPDQSAQLLQALLSIQDLPESLREQIIQRSAGLPFYLEEILRMLIERNIIFRQGESWRLTPGSESTAIGVPETLQGLILTRFDRLTMVQRRLLQTASVIGYQFSYKVLNQVMIAQVVGITNSEFTGAINYLIEREFIQPQSTSEYHRLEDDLGGEPGYQFKHVLVSDAVYSTLLQRDRRELHTRVGEAIERIYSNRLDSYVEVLAGHFLRSPYLNRALFYLLLAGKKAAHSFANEQALQLFRQALELLPNTEHVPEQAVQVHVGLGDALLTAGDYAQARDQFIRAMDKAGMPGKTGELNELNDILVTRNIRGTDKIRILSQLQRKIGKTHESQGDYEKALIYLQSAQKVLQYDQPAYEYEQANTLNDTGWIYFRRGNLDEAEKLFRQGLLLAEKFGQLDVTASILNRLAGIYFQRELVDQASSFLQRSLKLREQIGDVVAVARSYNNLGLLSWKQGHLTQALENFNRSYQLQANLGDVEGLIVLHTNMGFIEMDCGNLTQAQQHFNEALSTAGQIGHHYHICMANMHLALLHVYAGNWYKAVEFGQLSLVGFQELGVGENLIDINVSLGWAYLGLGDETKVNEIQNRIKILLNQEEKSPGSMSEGQGRAYRLLARCSSDRGDLVAAKDQLEKSIAIFLSVGSNLERSRSLVDLGNLLTAFGNIEQARQLFSEARAVFQQMGAKLDLAKMELMEQNLN